MEAAEEFLHHTIPPVYDENSEILILGSFPSVKSRESGFFYGHPQNRFWRLLARIKGRAVPQTIPDKKRFLLETKIALWDVISVCRITGSDDNSIRDEQPNDILKITGEFPVRAILLNGAKAHKLFQKYFAGQNLPPAVKLPSTSPANAAWSLDRLAAVWEKAFEPGTRG